MHATNFLVAVVLGAAVSIYIPMISRASSIMGSPILGSIPYFAVGLVTSIAIAAMSGFRTADFFRVDGVPPWLFLAGVVSAVAIIITSFLIPRIGPGALFVLLVTGQILGDVFQTLFEISTLSLRQSVTPTHLLGRINASYQVLTNGAVMLGLLAGGFLAAMLSIQTTLWAAFAGITLSLFWMWPLRHIEKL